MTNVAARLAIHEAIHAAANFLLGVKIHSIAIGENEGVVHTVPSGDSFDSAVGLLAPHALEDALGFERSGDTFDEDQADRIIRKHVSSASGRAEARKVLEEAADALVLSPPFDTLRRALSPHLKPGTVLAGPEVEDILMEAYERHAETQAAYRRSTSGRREVHSRPSGPRYAPWYEVIDRDTKRVLYKGADEAEAARIHRRYPHSMKVGSIYS